MFNASEHSASTRTATSSKAARLIHAAALAAVLVPLGSVAVETSVITCTTSASSGGGGCSGTGGYTSSGSGTQSNTWKFFNGGTLPIYTLQISGTPTSNFQLDASDFVTTQGVLEDIGALDNFPGAICIPTFSEGECGLFRVFETGGTASWVNGYIVTITWFANADPNSQPPPNGTNTILQAHGSATVFGNALREIDYQQAPTPTDPGISGRGDDFSTFGAFTNVPEPTSMMLFGMGVAGLLHRAHKRKKNR